MALHRSHDMFWFQNLPVQNKTLKYVISDMFTVHAGVVSECVHACVPVEVRGQSWKLSLSTTHFFF